MEPQLTVIFCTRNGNEETKVFTERPLGMQFPNRMPIVIRRIREGSQAQQLGVEVGWTMHSVGCTPLAGMTISQACTMLRESSGPLPCCMLVRQPPLDAQSVPRLSAKLQSIGENEVVPFLKRLGFMASTANSWNTRVDQPKLHLGMVNGCRVISNPQHHTWYAIAGRVDAGEASSTRHWLVERRLAHIRALLHDPVKQQLGKAYTYYFEKARFAHHGAPPGTAMRIASWLAALSEAINIMALAPALVASILRFLEAPLLDENAGQAFSEGESPRSVTSNEEASRQEESCTRDYSGNDSQQETTDLLGEATDLLAEATDLFEVESTGEMPAQADSMLDLRPMQLG